ncbi:MAG: oligosaccharide flippase family protein [Treponema sp.]|nr:oligosaccharide flippase family protein [Treponema sp.]
MNNKKVENGVNQNDFQNNLWTFLSAGVFSVYISIVVLITARRVGLAEAGMVSFAAAIVTLASGLITFGVRIFQASDIRKEFSLQTYFGFRVYTALLSTVLITVFLFIGGFNSDRVIVISLFYFIFLCTGFADVFMGDLQQNGKMHVAGKMMVCAFGLNIITYTIIIYISGSLYISLISSCVVTFAVYIAWIWYYQNDFGPIRIKYDISAIKRLFKKVLPIFLAGIISSYLFNIHKYYLGFLETDESVAIITILLMPGTALQILCGSIFGGAEMTKTAVVYTSGNIKNLTRRINHQLLLAAAISVFFLLCVFVFGLPLLTWLFAVDLTAYKYELIITSIGGALFSVNIVLGTAIIVMRMQRAHFINILTVTLVVAPLMWFIIDRYGIMGAAFVNLAILAPLTIVLLIICRLKLAKLKTCGMTQIIT